MHRRFGRETAASRNERPGGDVQGQMHNIQEFFQALDRFTASAASAGHDAFFAPTFMSASADGVRILTPDQIAAAAPRMRAALDKVGRRSSSLLRVDEQTLDAHYVMTTSEWRWEFEPENQAPFDLTLSATHVLHRAPEGLRIVFYRSGDVMGALRQRGVGV
jgi:hypothetical protein